jgi:enediyne biosynthesis protein E4
MNPEPRNFAWGGFSPVPRGIRPRRRPTAKTAAPRFSLEIGVRRSFMKIRICMLACCALLVQSSSAQSFYDVGAYSNTQVECNTHGSGFFDYNNDGWDDIYVVHNTSLGHYIDLDNTLLKNLGNGWYSNVTFAAGVSGKKRWSAQGLAAADYDNDGDIDMVIAMGDANHPLFYKNQGDGTFKEAFLLMDSNLGYAARCLSFMDYNKDGFVDLLMLRNSTPEKLVNPMFLLYRNDRNGGFTENSTNAGLRVYNPDGDDLYGFAIGDVNLDGYPDFYVPRWNAPSMLWVNDGDGTFSEKTIQYGLPFDLHKTGAVFLDYDNDGDWDLFIKQGSPYLGQLFRNNGNNTFTDVSVVSGANLNLGGRTEDTVFGGGLTAADFDNDGNTDILSLHEFGWGIFLIKNMGDGTFTNATYGSGLSQSQYRWYWTAPVADYNHDGYMDIYMARSPGIPTYASLYKNNGGAAKWLKIRLTGACRSNPPRQGSNQSGVGARVVAYMGSKKMTRMVQGGDSYKVNSFTVHFGMKWTSTMDSVKVFWPNGIVQTAVDIPANSTLDLAEMDTVQYFGPLFVSGTARYVAGGHVISQAVMSMTGDVTSTLLTDVNGSYKFKPINYGTPSLTVVPSKPRGEDVDPGVMTSYDAALVLQSLTGLDTISTRQKAVADVNQNGTLDASDAALIARYAVGIRNDAQSRAGAWVFTPASRTYTNVSTVYKYQDFQGTLFGDVSENWGNPGGSGKAAPAVACPDRISVARGSETVEIPVSSEPGTGLVSADVWLRFDSSRLEFLGVSATELTAGFSVVANGEDGDRVKIAMYGARPVLGGGVAMNIRFRVKGAGLGHTVVQWEKIAFNERELPASETQLAAAESESGAPEKFGLTGNYPNPFNPSTIIEYASDRDGDIRLTVFDMQGREVRALARGWRAAGGYEAEWDGKDALGRETPTGLYFCRLETEGRVSVIKMLKAR